MAKASLAHLSRRERQIMDIVYQRGQASAAEVRAALPDPPSYSAVRALLRLLEEKGRLKHAQEGLKYIFQPTMPREAASRLAMRNLLQTFFDGSIERAVASMLKMNAEDISDEELDRLSAMIEEARKEGR